MINNGMNRRGFLRLLAGAVFIPMLKHLQPFGFGGPSTQDTTSMAARKLIGLLGNRASASVVGRAYLSVRPAEKDARRLVSLLTADRLPLAALLDADAQTLRARVQAALSEDFAQGQTVDVQGWMLSVTESRLCALAALS